MDQFYLKIEKFRKLFIKTVKYWLKIVGKQTKTKGASLMDPFEAFIGLLLDFYWVLLVCARERERERERERACVPGRGLVKK